MITVFKNRHGDFRKLSWYKIKIIKVIFSKSLVNFLHKPCFSEFIFLFSCINIQFLRQTEENKQQAK